MTKDNKPSINILNVDLEASETTFEKIAKTNFDPI
jgi:hypothetical protein